MQGLNKDLAIEIGDIVEDLESTTGDLWDLFLSDSMPFSMVGDGQDICDRFHNSIDKLTRTALKLYGGEDA